MDGTNRLALRVLRAFLIGVVGMLLPLACGACSLVIRGGNDLETAGNRITSAAVWAKHELSGSTTLPPQARHSSAPASTGANAGIQYLPSDECSWENIKPNC
jgi:hypothetical protein